jgi:hypothetical protein
VPPTRYFVFDNTHSLALALSSTHSLF